MLFEAKRINKVGRNYSDIKTEGANNKGSTVISRACNA